MNYWYYKAKRIKEFIIFQGYKIMNFNQRHQMIKDFYSCNSESIYKLYYQTYNKVIINKLS